MYENEQLPVSYDSLAEEGVVKPSVLVDSDTLSSIATIATSSTQDTPENRANTLNQYKATIQVNGNVDVLNEVDAQLKEEELDLIRGVGATQTTPEGVVATANAYQTISNEEFDDYGKYKRMSRSAVEKIAITNSNVVQNNSIDEINKAIEAQATGLTVGQYISRLAEPDEATGNWITTSIDLGTSALILPSLYNNQHKFTGAVRSVMGEGVFNGPITHSTALEAIRARLSASEPSIRKQLIDDLYKELTTTWSLTRTNAARMMLEIADPNTANETVMDGMDIIPGVGAIAGIGKAVKVGKKMVAAGVPAKEVGALIARGLLYGVEKNALGASLKEAGGAAHSFDISSVLPLGISGTASGAQALLVAKTKELIANLNATIKSASITPEEMKDAVEALKKQFDPTVNPSIHSVQFVDTSADVVKSTIIHQHSSGKPYMTKEAAERAAKLYYPGRTMEVVPATSQVGFVLKEDAVKALEKEIEALRTSLRVKSKLPIAESVVYKNQINKFETGEMGRYASTVPLTIVDEHRGISFAGTLDDIEQDIVHKVQEGALTREDADALLDVAYRKLSSNPEQVKLSISAQDKTSALAKQEASRILANKLSSDEYVKTLNNYPSLFDLDGLSGVRVSTKSTLSQVLKNGVEKAVKDLGIEQYKLVVGTFDDLSTLMDREHKALRDYITTLGYDIKKESNGFYVTANSLYQGSPAMIMLGKQLSAADEVSTLVHELGHHFFKTSWQRAPKRLQDAVRKEFDAYLAQNNKSLANGLFKSMQDFESFYTKFRAPSETYLEKALLKGRGKAATDELRDIQASEMARQWYKSYDEWFSEQLVRYANAPASNLSLVGKWFKELATTIQRLYANVARVFGVEVVQPNVAFKSAVEEWLSMSRNTVLSEDAGLDSIMSILNGPHLNLSGAERSKDLRRLVDLEERLAAHKSGKAELSQGWVLKETREDFPTVGTFSESDISSAYVRLGIDPKHRTSELLVEQRVVGVHQEARIRKLLGNFIREPFDKLSKNEKLRVENVLVKGDAFSDAGGVGKEFNTVELLGQGLNQKEIDAYFAVRTARNVMHQLRDSTLVNSLKRQGWKDVTIGDFSGHGRLVDDVSVLIGRVAWDVDGQKRIVLSAKLLQEYAASGRNVYQMNSAHEVGSEAFTRLVGKGEVKEIASVLPRRPGEFARIYSDEYFIKAKVNKVVDGESIVDEVHIKTAASKADASEYVSALNNVIKAFRSNPSLSVADVDKLIGHMEDSEKLLARLHSGEFESIGDVSWHYTRTEDDYLNNFYEAARSAGRTFTSKRGERLTSVSSGRDNTLNVYESLQAEVTNVSRVASLTSWRESAIERWYNTFKEDLPLSVKGNDPTKAFFEMAGKKYVGSNDRNKFAENVHKYIMDQLGVKNMEEQFWEGVVRSATERYMPGSLETIGASLRQSNPAKFFRTVTFHSMLGMLNPAQLIVQANGAATAIILSPIHGLHAAKTAPLLRIALMSDNPEVWKKIANLNKISDLGMSSSEEFVKTVGAIRKSGLLDGINSTSLYNIEDGRFNIFSKPLRRLGETSAFFFNRGEEFSRIVSFDVAKREWIKAHPNKDWTSAQAIREILVRQDDLTQNMTKANETFFQKGVLSVPFQFLQYNLKLASNIIGAFGKKSGSAYRGFTKGEAATLLAGHIVLYGVANQGLGMFLEEVVGESMTKADWTDEQRLYVTQGIIAGLINTMAINTTGEELQLAVGKRLATFDWFGSVTQAMLNDQGSALQVLLGASYGTLSHMGVLGDVYKLWKTDPDISLDDVLTGFKMIAVENITTLRNADKMYLAYLNNHRVATKTGDGIARVNNMELLAQALGIPSAEVADLDKVLKNKKDHFDTLKRLAGLVNTLDFQAINCLNQGDREGYEGKLQQKRAIISSLPQGDLQWVLNELKDNVYPYDTRLEKEISKYLDTNLYGIKEPLITNRDVRETKIGTQNAD